MQLLNNKYSLNKIKSVNLKIINYLNNFSILLSLNLLIFNNPKYPVDQIRNIKWYKKIKYIKYNNIL